jgi:hypothetical protein
MYLFAVSTVISILLASAAVISANLDDDRDSARSA